MSTYAIIPLLIYNLFVFLGTFQTVEAKSTSSIQYRKDDVSLDLGGKLTNESYFSENMTLLNAKVTADSLFYMRTTADYFISIAYGPTDSPRLIFYDSIRFRFKWGTATEAKTADSFVTVVDLPLTVKGTATNKHLLWIREGWLKVALGDDPDYNHFFQVGLIPYQVGRGISLGAAYDAAGFLGFNPGFQIDQYAPGAVISYNPIKDRFMIDAYVALLENLQTSLTENLEIIRKNELNSCGQRGVGRQSILSAIRADILVFEAEHYKFNIEPYLVYQHAPDQDLEFKNDANSYTSTAGCAVEGIYKNWNWGFELGFNFGEYDILAWDRNEIKFAKNNDTGYVYEQYSKVYTQDPATVAKPLGAPVTNSVTSFLKGSPTTVAMNGKEIGTVDINGTPTPLYNAFNRFRPEQRRILGGYFGVADFTWDVIPKVLSWSFGIGYASGYNDPLRDVNKTPSTILLNEQFNAFVPIQSVYFGTRLNHLVLFNQGVPRFNVVLPNADLSKNNVTPVLQTDTINEMTNIAFIGTNFSCKVPQLKEYKVTLVPNIICYWIPEPASFLLDLNNPDSKTTASNFLGTEFTAKFSAIFFTKLALQGYLGVLVPGNHYRNMSGTIVSKYKLPTGCDTACVGNIGLAYLF
ncbi:hypothetical protein KBD08_01015 [Candidatus Babeliales bacterium]|nr:hypothetical protein [Candidatus Babeliales bacterium]